MQSITPSTRLGSFELRVTERSRGTAHPHTPMSQRERVVRSLMLRPDAPARAAARR
jgi:hypothetical protein